MADFSSLVATYLFHLPTHPLKPGLLGYCRLLYRSLLVFEHLVQYIIHLIAKQTLLPIQTHYLLFV